MFFEGGFLLMYFFRVSERKLKELEQRMGSLNIKESDIKEEFIRGSGPGGQKINKASTCVRLYHRPSGIMVRCQRERLQSVNRYLARRLLCDLIERKLTGEIASEKARIAKLRRQKRQRSRRAKLKVLEQKHKNSEKKAMRKPVNLNEW
ncbi:MAG: peptide chain release factor-like protein [Candidatus Hydrogenedentota bacterium]